MFRCKYAGKLKEESSPWIVESPSCSGSAEGDARETADKKIVGYILLSEAKVVSGSLSHTVLAVAPLAVLPAFQGKGTGGMLIRAAHSKASELGYGAAVLLGHPEYYPKFGYQKASLFGIQFPFDAPDPCCMAIALKEHGLDDVQGMVSYPDAFYQ